MPLALSADWDAVVVGLWHTVAIKKNGTLWAWGKNNYGQLGVGTIESSAEPAQIGTSADWLMIAVGDEHTMALKRDGTLWGWGRNDWGQLGVGTLGGYRPVPVPVVAGSTFFRSLSVSVGLAHSCALDEGLVAQCWGANGFGQLGDGTSARGRATPAPVAQPRP